MTRRVALLGLATCIAVEFCSAAFPGDVPQLLNYQGKLADDSGMPVDGLRQMVFEFYDAATGGNLIAGFSETQQVIVAKGVFSVLIGSGTEGGVPASVFDGAEVYLSVKVQGEELSPRQRITSVAYAVRSASASRAASATDADALQGHPASDFALQAALVDVQTRLAALEGRWWTLTIEPPQGNGTTSPGTGSSSYTLSLSSLPILATSTILGCPFDHWEGSAVTGDARVNPIIIPPGTGGQVKTLKAVFFGVLSAPMCAVPAGTFKTSTGVDVYLDAYLMDKYEITNELYFRFLITGGNDDHWHSEMAAEISRTGAAAPYVYYLVEGFAQKPVHSVTWFDAVDFCTWRSAVDCLPAGSYRLPTEAEWEKAAGWGDPARTSLWTYAFQSDTIDHTQATYSTSGGTTTVGSHAAWKSWYGCYDMTGNVMEWCSDWYGDSYPTSTSNPTGRATGTYRVLRGGSYIESATYCRIAYRYGYGSPSSVYGYCGFRCARTAP